MGAGTASNTVTVTLDVANTRPRRNPDQPLDVNADGSISAIDALLIINEINKNGSHAIPSSTPAIAPFWDVNGDGFVSSIDVLRVVNSLNGVGSPEGESVAADSLTRDQGIVSDSGASNVTVLPFVDQSFWARQLPAVERSSSVHISEPLERFNSPVDAAFAAASESVSADERVQSDHRDFEIGDLVDRLAKSRSELDVQRSLEMALDDLFGRE